MAYTRVLEVDNLLPCPFCGEPPRCIAGFEYGWNRCYTPEVMIECQNCGINVELLPSENDGGDMDDEIWLAQTVELAIEKWNTRHLGSVG